MIVGMLASKSTPVFQATDSSSVRLLRGGYATGSARTKGSYHEKNEDSVKIFPSDKPTFIAVADGVGGGSHGDVASEALLEYLKVSPSTILGAGKRFVEWFNGADSVVASAVALESAKPGATTVAAVWFSMFGRATVANVGDCRVYLYLPGKVPAWRQITVDQTYANLNLCPPVGGSGDDPARMIGVGAAATPNIYQERLSRGAAMLLCTDGLHKFVSDANLVNFVRNASSDGVAVTCKRLVDAAVANGGHDDATALIAIRRPFFLERERHLLVVLAMTIACAAGVVGFEILGRIA